MRSIRLGFNSVLVLKTLVLFSSVAPIVSYAQLLDVCSIQAADLKHAPATATLKCTPVSGGAPYSQSVSLPAVKDPAPCATLPDVTERPGPVDAGTLAPLLSAADLSITPQGNGVLLFGAVPDKKTGKPIPVTSQRLSELHESLRILLETVPANPAPFSMELAIPHAAALGARLSGISTTFTVTSAGTDRVVVSSKSRPSCTDWQAFLSDARAVVWSVHPESAEARLTALNASDAATALGGSSGGTPSTPAPAPAPVPASFTISVGSSSATPVGAGGSAKSTPAAAGATTPVPTTVTVAATPAAPAPTPTGPTSGSGGASTSAATVGFIAPDLLAFSDSTPGDDGAIAEKKRIAAVLDLPRPEMTISAWVMQNSSTDPRSVNEASRLVRQEVQEYNEGLGNTIAYGWSYLKAAMADPKFFNQDFHDYVANRVIFDRKAQKERGLYLVSPTQNAEAVLREEVSVAEPLKSTYRTGVPGTLRNTADYLGVCSQETYCLGYTTLFNPIKPRLMDLLLALIASENPREQAICSVEAAEGLRNPSSPCSSLTTFYQLQACDQDDAASPCKVWTELVPGYKRKSSQFPTSPLDYREAHGCEERDYIGVLQSTLRIPAAGQPEPRPVLFLNCFQEKASRLLQGGSSDSDPVSGLGLTRAAIADFLFNYKMSQQYPHEFSAYDLSTSAQAMNSALRPMVDAFIEDVSAFQAVLKRRLGLEIEDMNKRITRGSVFDKPRFFNNAIVTVNTIANSEASVDTATESYLEALNPPTLGGLGTAVLGTGPTSSSTSGATGLSSLLSSARLGEAQAIAAGLSQFQSSRIHLGRELMVDVKPESLAGASAAELQVILKADDESGSGAYSSGTATGDAEVSRFGKGDTTTRVRVDSLKLFDVSSFATELEVPKKRFPLLPVPMLEMPYFGSILSIPVRPAREFHSSMAVMSAIVIPTAADLAFTTRFVGDKLVAAPDPLWHGSLKDPAYLCTWPTIGEISDPAKDAKAPRCIVRSMVSLRDFAGAPVREFNRMKTHCFATNGRSATPNLIPPGDPLNTRECATLSFDNVLRDAD